MSDRFVTIERHHDPIAAAARKAALEEEGIVVSSPGLEHRSLLGIAGGFVEIHLQVREADLDAARELLQALDDPDEVEPIAPPRTPDIGGPYRSGEADEGYGIAPRKKMVATFCAMLLTFGCGHSYARESQTGAWLALLEVVALLGAMFLDFPALAGAIPMLVLYDIIGSRRAVERYNAGRTLDGPSQLRRMPIPLVLALLGALAFPHLEPLFEEPKEAVQGVPY